MAFFFSGIPPIVAALFMVKIVCLQRRHRSGSVLDRALCQTQSASLVTTADQSLLTIEPVSGEGSVDNGNAPPDYSIDVGGPLDNGEKMYLLNNKNTSTVAQNGSAGGGGGTNVSPAGLVN